MNSDDPTNSALARAVRAGNDAARYGFDWERAEDALDKVAEEAAELREALRRDPLDPAVAEELGDLYFAVSNVARKLGLDPDDTLTRATEKFERRFNLVLERVHASGREPRDLTLDELEELWVACKGGV